MNPISTDGAISLLQCLKESPNCTLQHLDLQGQTVDQNFVALKEEIRENRVIKITHGRVLVQHALEVRSLYGLFWCVLFCHKFYLACDWL